MLHHPGSTVASPETPAFPIQMSTMTLLERHSEAQRLQSAWNRAADGAGSVVLVSGEAGIGKTALVEQFAVTARALPSAPRVLWGACDALFTPRPFGPLHDIAAQGLVELDGVLGDPNRSTLFARAFALLTRSATVAVFEDVHWADEATLDFVMYLGRRLARRPLLLIATYRDDELSPQHPLRNALGVLASTSGTLRLDLAPLSVSAVQALATSQGIDGAELHAATGGNPFLITEALANPISGVPATVRDAVLARAARLSPSARAVLEAAAVIGPRIEPWLLTAVTGAEAPSVDECLEAGLLHGAASSLAFRHELTRQAVLDALSPHRRLVLHRLALTALCASPLAASDPARIAHHANAAGDPDAILTYAPAAGRAAARTGAHREAAALFGLALQHAHELPAEERAALFEARAEACNHIDDRAGSLQARREALEIWRRLDNTRRVGENLALGAMQLNGLGRTEDAERDCQSAIDLLSTLPAGRELAHAYRIQAGLRMLTQDYQSAITLGEKAIVLARAAGANGIAFAAQNTIGCAWMPIDFEHGRRDLEQNLHATHAAGLEPLAALAYTNLSSGSSELYRFGEAERYFREGSAYALERGLERYYLYMLGWQAHTLLRLGRWAECERAATEVIARPNVSATSRITALAVLGRLRCRRGDPDAAALLDEALFLCRDLHSLHRLGLVRTARAEAAWLVGDLERARGEVEALAHVAVAKQHPWFAGELLFWLQRTGADVSIPTWLARPYALQIQGKTRESAMAWRELGCVYEAAQAQADGDAAEQTEALESLERLGARPAAEQLRERIRLAGGVVPRGPRASTRKNAFGLTTRQLDIVHLLIEGLTNTEIAARLHLSAKTVDHHVSAVLAKLGVSTRSEAAALMRGSDVADR